MSEKQKPRVRDVTVPGQAGARIINEFVTKPLKTVTEKLNGGQTTVTRGKKK